MGLKFQLAGLALKNPRIMFQTVTLLDEAALRPFIQTIEEAILAIDSKSESDLKKGLLLALNTAKNILENLKKMDTSKKGRDYNTVAMDGINLSDLLKQFKDITQSIFSQALEKFKSQSERDIGLLPEGSLARLNAQAVYEKSLQDMTERIAFAMSDNTKAWYQNLAEASATPELQALFPYIAAVMADQGDVLEMLALTTQCFQSLINQPLLQGVVQALQRAEKLADESRQATVLPEKPASPSLWQSIPGFRPETPAQIFEKEEAVRRRAIFGALLDAMQPLIGENLRGVVDTLKTQLGDDEIKTSLPTLQRYLSQLSTVTHELSSVNAFIQLLATPRRTKSSMDDEQAFHLLFMDLKSRFTQDHDDSGYSSRSGSLENLTDLDGVSDEENEVFFSAKNETAEEAMSDCLSQLAALCREVGLEYSVEITPMSYEAHQIAFLQQFFTPGLRLLSQYWADIDKQKKALENTFTTATDREVLKVSLDSLESKVKLLADYLRQAAQMPVLTLLGENPARIITTLMQGDYLQNLGKILDVMPSGVTSILKAIGVSQESWDSMIKPLLLPTAATLQSESDSDEPSPAAPTTPESGENSPVSAKKKTNPIKAIKGFFKKMAQTPGNIKRNFQYLRSVWPLVTTYLSAITSSEKDTPIFNPIVLEPLKTNLLEKIREIGLLSPNGRQPFQSVSLAMLSALVGVFSILKDLKVTDVVSIAKSKNPTEVLLDRKVMLDEKAVSLKTLLTHFLDTLSTWLPDILEKMPLKPELKLVLAQKLTEILNKRQEDPLKCLMSLMAYPPDPDSPLGKELAKKGTFALLSPILADIFSDKEGVALLSAAQGVLEVIKTLKPTTDNFDSSGAVIYSWDLLSPTASKVVRNLQKDKHPNEKAWITFVGEATNLSAMMSDGVSELLQIFKTDQSEINQETALEQLTKKIQAYQQQVLEHEQKYSGNVMLLSCLPILTEISYSLNIFMFELQTRQASAKEIQFATQILGPLLTLLNKFPTQLEKITAGKKLEDMHEASQQLYGYLEMVALGVKTALDNPIFVKASENFMQLVQEGLKTPPDTQKILALLPKGIESLLGLLIQEKSILDLVMKSLLTPQQPVADQALRIPSETTVRQTLAPTPVVAAHVASMEPVGQPPPTTNEARRRRSNLS